MNIISLTLSIGCFNVLPAQDAWAPVAQPGQPGAQPGLYQSGWTRIPCGVQAPTGVYADPATRSVAVWSGQQIAISRDSGDSYAPAIGLGPLRDVAEVALVAGHQITRTTEGKVIMDGGSDIGQRCGLGQITKLAISPSGYIFISDGVNTASFDVNHILLGTRTQGDLGLVVEDSAYAFKDGKATELTLIQSRQVDVNGPRPTGWPARTGPSVAVAYDSNGCRYERRGDGLICTSQIGRNVLIQASSETKNGYFHLAVAGTDGLMEIACFSPRTGDAGPTHASQNMPPLTSVASLGTMAGNASRYMLVGVGPAGVMSYYSP